MELTAYYVLSPYIHSESARLRIKVKPCAHRNSVDVCSIWNWNSEKAAWVSLQTWHSGAQRQEICQTASAGGCGEHVHQGTRNCLMINHCQPLFSLKTWLSDKACNEGLFWCLLLWDCVHWSSVGVSRCSRFAQVE